MKRTAGHRFIADPLGDGNAFERGSRHPKWRGGTDKRTLSNRQKAYRKYGIGVAVSSNSTTESLSDSPRRSPIIDFRAGRISDIRIARIASVQDVNKIIKKILTYDGLLFDENQPQSTRVVTIRRVQYRLLLDMNENLFTLHIKNTGVISKPTNKITLLVQLRREAKMRQKALYLKQKQLKLRKHSNFIKGLEKLK